MARSSLFLRAGAAALAITTAVPAWAQIAALEAVTQGEEKPAAEGGKPAEGAPAAEAVATGPAAVDSHFCPLSFFTDGNDVLDLRAQVGAGCFDTGRGRDVLRIQPGDFPEGVVIVSGRGRSVLAVADSPAVVFDQEATAEEIRTGPRNDAIRLGLGFVGAEGFVQTPPTRIITGGGDDLVVIGSGTRPVQAPRLGANATIEPGVGALTVEAGCGRPMDADTIDATVSGAPEGARVYVQASGCGVSLRDHRASTILDQTGGRTAAQLAAAETNTPIFFDAFMERSAGLGWGVYNPRADARLEWSGFGTGVIDVAALLPGTGGTYLASGDGTVFLRAEVGAGTPAATLMATERVEAVVEGGGTGRARMEVAAPVMRVEWWPTGAALPPEVIFTGGGQVLAEPYHIKAQRRVSRPAAVAVASTEAEPAPVPAEPVVEPVVEAVPVGARDAQGFTEPGRAAILAGVGVGAKVPDGAMVEDWKVEPVYATAGEAEVVLRPLPGWCEAVVLAGGVGQEERRLPCGEAGEARLVLGDSLRIEGVDGAAVVWPVGGLAYPASMVVQVAPRR